MARIKYYNFNTGQWEYADRAHASNSSQNANGLSAKASALLITILRNGVYSTDQSANITALATELAVTEPEEPDTPVEPDEPATPEKTLTSISATYNGGDVAVGTAVADLTGIVVTAHYSDGTSETVTGYTLSGTIAEGANTVTVSYGGKTTTFTVVGVAESGGGEPVVVNIIELPNRSFATTGGKKVLANDNGTYCAAFYAEPNTNYRIVDNGTHDRFRFYGRTTVDGDATIATTNLPMDGIIADNSTNSSIDSLSEIEINSGEYQTIYVYLATNSAYTPNITVRKVG